MVAITTTSLSSANSAVSENKCTSAIFAQIDRHHPHQHHPYHTIIYRMCQFLSSSSLLTLSSTFMGYYGGGHFGCFWYIYPSPGHLSSQCWGRRVMTNPGNRFIYCVAVTLVFRSIPPERPAGDWDQMQFATFFVGWKFVVTTNRGILFKFRRRMTRPSTLQVHNSKVFPYTTKF